MPKPGRPLPRVSVLASVLAIVTGCTVGPSTRPPLATYGPPGGGAATSVGSAGPTTAIPTGPGGPGRESEPARWASCADDISAAGPRGIRFQVDCASITVPLSYHDQGSAPFALRIARARADGLPDSAPALVVVDGEPGEHGRSAVASVAEGLPEEIRQKFAVVTLDLRGTGRSAPTNCMALSSIGDIISLDARADAPTAPALVAKVARQITFDCGDAVGPNLSRFNTTAAADDLDSVRAALGASTLTFLGTGFGATLGAVYADRYPGRVGRLILDGPSDPLSNPSDRAKLQSTALAAALTQFVAACPDFTGGCPLGIDPRATIARAVSGLADPAPATDGLLVSSGTVALALTTHLGHPDSWPALAAAIAAAADGTVDRLSTLIADRYALGDRQTLLEPPIVYGCNDSTQRLPPAEAAAQATAAGADNVFLPYLLQWVSLCSSWPAPEQPLGRVTAAGAAPILVLGAVGDPVSPYEAVRSLSGQLSTAVLVTWQSAQHGGYPGGRCLQQVVDAYLLDGTTPAVGTLCPP